MWKKLTAAAIAIGIMSLILFHGDAPLRPVVPIEEQRVVTREASDPTSPASREPSVVPSRTAIETSRTEGTTEVVVTLRDATDGRPLPGYGVALRPAAVDRDPRAPREDRISDDMGRVQFTDLEPGSWLVDIDRIDREPQVEALAGVSIEHVVELSPSFVVRGIVRDPLGVPVAGASVYSIYYLGRFGTRLAMSAADGSYEIRHYRKADELSIRARHEGYAASAARDVSLGPGGIGEFDLTLGAGGPAIVGVARDPDGQPLRGTPVAIVRLDEQDKADVHPLWISTDRDGRFQTTEIGLATYLFRSAPADHPPASEIVDTNQGAAFIELRSARPAVLTGRVWAGGEPMRDAQVVIQGLGEGGTTDRDAGSTQSFVRSVLPVGVRALAYQMVDVEDDGTYRIEGIPPGEADVQVWRGMNIVFKERIDIREGEVHEWNPGLSAVASISVKVRCDGKLPNTVWAAAVPESDPEEPVVGLVWPDEASLEVAGYGTLRVTLTTTSGNSRVILADVPSIPRSRPEVTIDVPVDNLPRSTLSGRLVDQLTVPRADQAIRVRREDGRASATTRTASDGQFSLGPLPLGTYELLTDGPGGEVVLRRVEIQQIGAQQIGDVR